MKGCAAGRRGIGLLHSRGTELVGRCPRGAGRDEQVPVPASVLFLGQSSRMSFRDQKSYIQWQCRKNFEEELVYNVGGI